MISPSSRLIHCHAKATMLVVHGSTSERARADGRADVVAIGERSERNIGPADRKDGDRQQPVEPVNLAVGEHRAGEAHQYRHAQRRAEQRQQERIGDDAGVGFFGVGEQLGETAAQAEGGELRREFDD